MRRASYSPWDSSRRELIKEEYMLPEAAHLVWISKMESTKGSPIYTGTYCTPISTMDYHGPKRWHGTCIGKRVASLSCTMNAVIKSGVSIGTGAGADRKTFIEISNEEITENRVRAHVENLIRISIAPEISIDLPCFISSDRKCSPASYPVEIATRITTLADLPDVRAAAECESVISSTFGNDDQSDTPNALERKARELALYSGAVLPVEATDENNPGVLVLDQLIAPGVWSAI